MDSALHLLSQLRIDRSVDPKPSSGGWRPRSLALPVIAALVICAVVWWASAEPARMPERVAAEQVSPSIPVKPLRAKAPPAGAAALDTSGYVVARRQATVSSKATGRVAEVLDEEGQRVEQGQIIARLDSSMRVRRWPKHRLASPLRKPSKTPQAPLRKTHTVSFTAMSCSMSPDSSAARRSMVPRPTTTRPGRTTQSRNERYPSRVRSSRSPSATTRT